MPAPDSSTGYAEGDAIVCQSLTQRYATFLPIVRQTYKSMFMQEQTDKEKKGHEHEKAQNTRRFLHNCIHSAEHNKGSLPV